MALNRIEKIDERDTDSAFKEISMGADLAGNKAGALLQRMAVEEAAAAGRRKHAGQASGGGSRPVERGGASC